MDKHPDSVEKYDGTLKELAHDVIRMKYSSVAEFFGYCKDELVREATGDYVRGRVKLASMLEDAVNTTDILKNQMDKIWNLCEPYMKKEKK
tara:strand:- start:80 stop:352 length:273 start_codon:yes stop_codon:yes gene_type:complete